MEEAANAILKTVRLVLRYQVLADPYIIARQCWGQGLVSEAALAILNYGFGVPKLKRLVCLIDPGNSK